MDSPIFPFTELPPLPIIEIMRRLTNTDRSNLAKCSRYYYRILKSSEDPTLDSRPVFDLLHIGSMQDMHIIRVANECSPRQNNMLVFKDQAEMTKYFEEHKMDAVFRKTTVYAREDFMDGCIEMLKDVKTDVELIGCVLDAPQTIVKILQTFVSVEKIKLVRLYTNSCVQQCQMTVGAEAIVKDFILKAQPEGIVGTRFVSPTPPSDCVVVKTKLDGNVTIDFPTPDFSDVI